MDQPCPKSAFQIELHVLSEHIERMAKEHDTQGLISRRTAMAMAASMWAASAARAQGPASAKLKSIKMATVGVPNVIEAAAWYSRWLSYVPLGRGRVSKNLALSWGTPNMAGREQILLQPESGAEVFIRLVAIDAVPDYTPLRSYGWSAIEIAVKDADALQATFDQRDVRIIGRTEALGPGSPIRAMQVLGPGGEVIYLASHTGDREKSNHPEISSFVDRPFIVVLAGPDLDALKIFYRDQFALGDQGDLSLPVRVLSNALGLPPSHVFRLSVLVMSERGNKLELDGLPPPAGPRPRSSGQLPPGVAITSFSVGSLDDISVPFVIPPQAHYGSVRSGCIIGPVGEIIELIEDQS